MVKLNTNNYIYNPIYALCNLIKENLKPNFCMAEIGCFDGSTTRGYIELIKKCNGKLHIVDWFKGNIGALGPHTYIENDNSILNLFKENLKDYLDIISIHKGDSSSMISNIADRSLDLCFIDADHRYSAVYNDIKLCIPKMKPGGILCGHDMEGIEILTKNEINPEWYEKDCVNGIHYGVIKAVYDHFGNNIDFRCDIGGQEVDIWIKRL